MTVCLKQPLNIMLFGLVFHHLEPETLCEVKASCDQRRRRHGFAALSKKFATVSLHVRWCRNGHSLTKSETPIGLETETCVFRDCAVSTRYLCSFIIQMSTDGGLSVSREMRKILDQPGPLSDARGGERLRVLCQDGKEVSPSPAASFSSAYVSIEGMKFDYQRLSEFGLSCFVGALDEVKKASRHQMCTECIIDRECDT